MTTPTHNDLMAEQREIGKLLESKTLSREERIKLSDRLMEIFNMVDDAYPED